MPTLLYETSRRADQYLLFHYGSIEETTPYTFIPKEAFNFPLRCVSECVDTTLIQSANRALEVGCSVGRSSFELTRYFQNVDAIDSSRQLITLAKELQINKTLHYDIHIEGSKCIKSIARLPENVFPDRVKFHCADILQFDVDTPYDLILAANLLCRLSTPYEFLAKLPKWISSKGILILISPYSWRSEYTPKELWPEREGLSSFEFINEALHHEFTLKKTFDIPYLLREHAREYQLGISQATIWQKH